MLGTVREPSAQDANGTPRRGTTPDEATAASTLEITQAATLGEPTFDELNDPDRLGHYRILDLLGRGGMGVVYAAHDTKLDRKVAIKQLRAKGKLIHQQRLLREALAMAKLSHPNVVPIYEIGEQGDSTFIVMEYVEGTTLREWLAIPRSQAEILTTFKAAARGLIAAHQKGLVHRDFKPDNVMVGATGPARSSGRQPICPPSSSRPSE
jgi:serine/threonine protein kinase